VRVRRVPAETLQVWESVLRPRGFVLAGGRLARSPTKSQSQPRTPCPGPLPRPARAQTLQNLPRPRGSALAGLSRAGSFAPSARDASTPKAPFARAATRPLDSPSFFGGMRAREEGEGEEAVPATDKDVPPPAPVYNAEAGPSRPRLPAVFSGLKILARGEAQCANVFKAIEGGGGEALRDDDGIAEADFVVIRLKYIHVSSSVSHPADADAQRERDLPSRA
jgi:DNA replication regulator DPB11